MSVLSWVACGLIAGFIASRIVNRSAEDYFLDIILGVVGALVGGRLLVLSGEAGEGGLLSALSVKSNETDF